MIKILILGAAYGLLPGLKLSLAGHAVTLVGRADEIAAMAKAPLQVRITARRSDADFLLSAPIGPAAPGQIALTTPDQASPAAHDILILAMQEPHYQASAVAHLLAQAGQSSRPCLSIMNLPPPPFLTRLGINPASLTGIYHAPHVWSPLSPDQITLASPDPQAVRPDPAQPGRLHCTLASNFKAAPFARAADQALLQRLADDMSRLAVPHQGRMVRPPVAMVASPSLFVPLAKWPMLIAGNCRCLLPSGIRTIADAVHADLAETAALYAEVSALATTLGARPQDMVPFESYAETARRLTRPSSLARALESGATAVERIDRLITTLLEAQGLETARLAPISARIDTRLAQNRAAIVD